VGKTRPPGFMHFTLNYDSGNDRYWILNQWSCDPDTLRWQSHSAEIKGLSGVHAHWLRPGLAYDPDGRRFLWWRSGVGVFLTPGSPEAKRIPDGPPDRSYLDGGLVYDPKNRAFVLFGGCIGGKQVLGDTWAFYVDAGRWRQLRSPVGPPARWCHRLHWSDKLGAVVMCGGAGADKAWFNDAWVLETAAERWTRLEPTGNAPPATEMATAWDDARGALVTFNPRGATWTLEIGKAGRAR
jgi:hypothetical protein